MLRPYRKLSFLVAFLLFLSACSEQIAPLTSETQVSGHLKVFQSKPGLYSSGQVVKAINNGKLGDTASKAVVPLLFKNDGQLMKLNDLKPLVQAKEAGNSSMFRSTSALLSFLRENDMTLYFTDFTTFKTTVQQLASDKRLSLKDYAPLRSKYAIRQELAAGPKTRYVHLFVPYVDEATLKQMKRLEKRSVVFSGQETCSPDELEESDMFTNVSMSANVNPLTLDASFTGLNEVDGPSIQPQQQGCQFGCSVAYAEFLRRCPRAPFPAALLCATAASGALGLCLIGCALG